MVEHDGGTIRAVAWLELFPWLGIVRVFRLSIAVRALLFGAVGILLTVTGWGVVGMIFGTDLPATRWLDYSNKCPWTALAEAVPNRPTLPCMDVGLAPEMSSEPIAQPGNNPISGPWALLTLPALQGLANTSLPVRAVACLVLCGLWGAAVWAFFGAAICRTAAVRLAADERVGWGAALRYAGRKWPAYFAAPLLPIGGVLLAAIPVFVLGLIMRTNVGLLLGGILWPFALVAGFVMALLLLGTLVGWPLMWGAISAEGTDSFDALSRCYAYVFQRPLHYLFYVIVAGFIGWLGWLLVRNFAAGAIWLGYWAAGWGCGGASIGSIMGYGEPFGGVGRAGTALIRFWADCVKLLAVGYLFSYFWTASAAVYFLLRRDVDATEMDEVFLDADAGEPAADLPTITTDQAGAPVAEDDVVQTPSDDPPESTER